MIDGPALPTTPAIRRSDDLAAALALARAAHLEIAATPSNPLALWGAFDDDRMVGTVSLDRCGGLPVVGRIAVEDGYRRLGLGRRLLAAVEDEAKSRGQTALWATARAPGFFTAMGYAVVEESPKRALLLSDCAQCERFGRDCHPEAVRKTLDRARRAPGQAP